MDFVTLANAAHETSRTVARYLVVETEEDDDFAHLEGLGHSTHHDAAAAAAGGVGVGADAEFASSGGVPIDSAAAANRPLLSPTAESALLELSTNFLLYVAMVVITVMVSRIYFPSCLEPREEPAGRRTLNQSYMSLMKDAYNSDFSDEEDEDDEGGEKSGDGGSGKELEGGEGLLDVEGGSGGGSASVRPVVSKVQQSSNFLFDELDQEVQSKQSVYTNLAICALMLNLTFVSWGLLQVRCSKKVAGGWRPSSIGICDHCRMSVHGRNIICTSCALGFRHWSRLGVEMVEKYHGGRALRNLTRQRCAVTRG